MKRCIFYLPYQLDENGNGARMLRPKKMIEAFKAIGYDVFVITGYSKDRRKLIQEVKNNIRDGIEYDFMYSESHTEPTLLTDPHHLPTHPFLDFGFFRYIHEHNIPIGLFYCDVYWKFDTYGKDLPNWKRIGALVNYSLDLHFYEKYLSKFYVPDKEVCSILSNDKLSSISEELPPGADLLKNNARNYDSNRPLEVFYVGGLGNHYQILELVKAVAKTNNCNLTICCRENEWEKEKEKYLPYLNESISIIHKNSVELDDYYAKADVCSLLFESNEYMKMAKPYKAFEYLAHDIPVIATNDSSIGRYVLKYDAGWAINNDEHDIANLLKMIINCPKLLSKKTESIIMNKDLFLWSYRAKRVVLGLGQ